VVRFIVSVLMAQRISLLREMSRIVCFWPSFRQQNRWVLICTFSTCTKKPLTGLNLKFNESQRKKIKFVLKITDILDVDDSWLLIIKIEVSGGI
jgi:hypothetical protein